MRYGVYDERLDMWLARKPVMRGNRLFSTDWQQSPIYPFTLSSARESLEKLNGDRYKIVSESGSSPPIQQDLF